LSLASYPTFWEFDTRQTALVSDSGTFFPASTPVMDDQAYGGHSPLGVSLLSCCPKRNAGRLAFRVSFVTLLNRSGQEMQIRIATTDGFRFSLHMIRVFRPGSKLCAVRQHPAQVSQRSAACLRSTWQGETPVASPVAARGKWKPVRFPYLPTRAVTPRLAHVRCVHE